MSVILFFTVGIFTLVIGSVITFVSVYHWIKTAQQKKFLAETTENVSPAVETVSEVSP